jgi:hypothetical protein
MGPRRIAWELILALLGVLAISVWYLWCARRGVPRASGALGHSLGVIGFLMMLSTETLYSLRKRLPRFSFLPTRTWLQVHIFTGIVGPYLVLLHSGWKFNGLAGVLTLLTILVVASGFVGRYIYTAVPRTLDGVEIAVKDLEQQILAADAHLNALGVAGFAPATLALVTASPRGWRLVLGRHYYRWQARRRLRQAIRQLGPIRPDSIAPLEQMLAERHRLQMQIDSLAVARNLLALWHVIHVPLGGVLFTLAFVHIGAALYYATFLK